MEKKTRMWCLVYLVPILYQEKVCIFICKKNFKVEAKIMTLTNHVLNAKQTTKQTNKNPQNKP